MLSRRPRWQRWLTPLAGIIPRSSHAHIIVFCGVFIFCLIYSACALTAPRHYGDGNDDDDDGDDGNSQIKFTVMKMLNLVQNITTTWDVMSLGFTMLSWRIMTSARVYERVEC